MSKLIDLTGQKFGRLTVVERADNTKQGQTQWKCECECGKQTTVSAYCLRSGHTKSCGCWKRYATKKHGQSRERIYAIWYGIKERCYNKKCPNYKKYGNKGITMCDEWVESFKSFYDWSMMNGYAKNLSLDRINNDKGYSPDNCRWVTVKEQNNNKSNNCYITYNGKTQTLKQWAEELNINYPKLRYRIKYYHWTIERAFNTK